MRILFVGFATVDIIKGKKYYGGAAGALSINAARLGIHSHLLAPLSPDVLGAWYTKKLHKEHVDISLCSFKSPSLPTCVINDVHGAGSRRKWNDNGALRFLNDMRLSPNELELFDIIFFANTHPVLIQQIAPFMRLKNAVYIPGPQIITKNTTIEQNLLNKTRLLFGNEEEMPHIMNTQPLAHGIELVVETRGKHGAQIYQKNKKQIHFSPPHVEHIIDTTGAGDIFALGFCIGYWQSMNVTKGIQKAHDLVSRKLLTKGALLS